MTVALYARVSTKNSQDPETQLLALREYAKARRLEVFGEYVDVGISGGKASRPALNELMADARKRLRGSTPASGGSSLREVPMPTICHPDILSISAKGNSWRFHLTWRVWK